MLDVSEFTVILPRHRNRVTCSVQPTNPDRYVPRRVLQDRAMGRQIGLVEEEDPRVLRYCVGPWDLSPSERRAQRLEVGLNDEVRAFFRSQRRRRHLQPR